MWEKDFPRTASMKIKRQALAEEIAKIGGALRQAIGAMK